MPKIISYGPFINNIYDFVTFYTENKWKNLIFKDTSLMIINYSCEKIKPLVEKEKSRQLIVRKLVILRIKEKVLQQELE